MTNTLIPKKKDPNLKQIIPPFEDLTMLIFGVPGAGKSCFLGSDPNTLFIGTEPGQDFIKAPSVPVDSWEVFRNLVSESWNYKFNEPWKSDPLYDDLRYNSFVIDIVDNLYDQCLSHVCAAKQPAYPPENDFGKTWREITTEWKTVIGGLMRVGRVRFISHAGTRKDIVINDKGLKVEIDKYVPKFSSGKAAVYLDGILNCMGYIAMDNHGNRTITFKKENHVEAKDRTGILEALGPMNIGLNDGYKTVSDAYRKKAIEMGFEIEPIYK